MKRLDNIRVRSFSPLVSPAELKLEVPVAKEAADTVVAGRETVTRVLAGEDERLIAVVGPCSIHDLEAGLEYARRLRDVAARVEDRLLVIMRTYFEKPRSVMGWKGLINDPNLDGTFDMGTGLRMARRFLAELAELGLPAATEMLDPITPQYISDLITMASIGARTTESQTHRQMASGLSMPIGYKNGTDGSLQTALDAFAAARHAHSFLGIDLAGRTCVINTGGNPDGCVILRGGRSGPNFSPEAVADALARLRKAGLPDRLIVDCSHANSLKDHTRQAAVWHEALRQRLAGDRGIIGLLLESNLEPGRQDLGEDPSTLRYGVSITDACVGWQETEKLLLEAHSALG